jgi:hypothetical protein
MVYLDGDNNLESCAIDDFLEMSSVSSTAGVNIVVQFDRIPSYSSAYDDWTTCKRFLVTPGMTPTPANALTDLGECNMGDPNTLSDFVVLEVFAGMILMGRTTLLCKKLSKPWQENLFLCLVTMPV